MTSYIVYTRNDEKKVVATLNSVLERLKEDDQLIIFDNHSTDQSVPLIVNTIGVNFKDEERFKFYIMMKKEPRKSVISKAKSIAKYEPIVIN